MVAVRIPGAESIENVAPARDPGVTASPDAFGAQIGTSATHFGDALDSLGAHLYRKQQAATDQVAEQTYNVGVAPRLQQNEIDARKAYPDGGEEYIAASQAGSVKAHNDTINDMAARGIIPSSSAFQRIGTTFAGYDMNARVGAVTYNNNAGVAKLQSALDDNNNLVASNVLAGKQSLKDGLATIPGNVEAGKSLYGGKAMRDKEEAWQQSIIDAAIKQKYASGDKEGGDAIAAQYYGNVPRSGDSNSARAKAAMDYFQSTGKTKEQAAGIVGNLIHESNLSTTASGDAGSAFGIAQWRGERQVELRAFARSKGKSPTDFQTQLEFINQELNTSEGDAHARLLAAKTTKDAAMAFVDYERPKGVGTSNPHGWSNRLGNAQALASGDKNVKLASADGVIPGDDEVSDKSTTSAAPAILPNVDKALYWRGQSKSVGIDLDRQDKLQKMQAERASKEAESGYLKDIFSEKPTATVQGIMNDDRLSVPAKLQLRAVAERQFKDDPLSQRSQQATMGLIDRMRKPDGDPDKLTDTGPIYDEYVKRGNLTRQDFEFAMKHFQQGTTDDGSNLGKLKTAFVKNAGDAIGLANLQSSMTGGGGTFQKYNFERYIDARVEQARAAKKDPAGLFDPNSSDYLGKLDNTGRPAILAPFMKSAQQDMREEASTIPTVAPKPVNAAERQRLDDWLRKRNIPLPSSVAPVGASMAPPAAPAIPVSE